MTGRISSSSGRNLTRTIVNGLLLYDLAWFLSFFAGPHFIDFPCGVVQQYPTEKCVRMPSRRRNAAIERPRMQVVLNTTLAGASGGGCYFEQSASDSVSVGGHRFERVGDHARVDGHDLAVGASYDTTSYVGLNPWTITYLKVTNFGPVFQCDLQQADFWEGPGLDAGLVVHGSTGSEMSPLKGLAITLTLLLARSRSKRVVRPTADS